MKRVTDVESVLICEQKPPIFEFAMYYCGENVFIALVFLYFSSFSRSNNAYVCVAEVSNGCVLQFVAALRDRRPGTNLSGREFCVFLGRPFFVGTFYLFLT